MRGVAVGAGLVTGILADISIASTDCRIIDGHTRLGVAAGDRAAIIWPLLIGMVRAKCEEAAKIGLICLAVADAELDDKSVELAIRLATGAQSAIRWTKHALNNWLRPMGPTFDASLALEFLGFAGPEPREGVLSHKEKRVPHWPDESPL